MEYDFENDYMGYPSAKFSMGHEAFGRWFTEELSNDNILLEKILTSISQIEKNLILEMVFPGKFFELTIESEQASVRALSLSHESEEELGDNLELFDQELMADCGLPDFRSALVSWSNFVS